MAVPCVVCHTTGVKVGRSLVEEQSGVLIYLMAALADLLGTPVTEMVWIQVRLLAYDL